MWALVIFFVMLAAMYGWTKVVQWFTEVTR
jgi:hypothetical protein